MIFVECCKMMLLDLCLVFDTGTQIRVPRVQIPMTFSESVAIPIPLSAVPVPTKLQNQVIKIGIHT